MAKKKAKKQSTPRLSTIASRVLEQLSKPSDPGRHRYIWHAEQIRRSDVKALAASVLSQDETKGQGRKR